MKRLILCLLLSSLSLSPIYSQYNQKHEAQSSCPHIDDLGDFSPQKNLDQLSAYRKIYDRIDAQAKKTKEDPYAVHDDELFNVLKNAFRLTKEYIIQTRPAYKSDLTSEKECLERLDALYVIAQEQQEENDPSSF